MPRCEKITEPKTLKIENSTLKKLKQLKLDLGCGNYSDTLDELIKWWNWWKEPGSGRGKGEGSNEKK